MKTTEAYDTDSTTDLRNKRIFVRLDHNEILQVRSVYLHQKIFKREERFAKGLRTQYSLTHRSWGYPTLIYLNQKEHQEIHSVISNIHLHYQSNRIHFSFPIIRKIFKYYQIQQKNISQESKTQKAQYRIKPISYQTKFDRESGIDFRAPVTLLKPVFLNTLSETHLLKRNNQELSNYTASTTNLRNKRIFDRLSDGINEHFRFKYFPIGQTRSVYKTQFDRKSGIDFRTPVTLLKPVFLNALSETHLLKRSKQELPIFNTEANLIFLMKLVGNKNPLPTLPKTSNDARFQHNYLVAERKPIYFLPPSFGKRLGEILGEPQKFSFKHYLPKTISLKNPFIPLIRCTTIEQTRSVYQSQFDRESGIDFRAPVTLLKPIFLNTLSGTHLLKRGKQELPILNTEANLIFLMKLVGNKNPLPTLPKSLNDARAKLVGNKNPLPTLPKSLNDARAKLVGNKNPLPTLPKNFNLEEPQKFSFKHYLPKTISLTNPFIPLIRCTTIEQTRSVYQTQFNRESGIDFRAPVTLLKPIFLNTLSETHLLKRGKQELPILNTLDAPQKFSFKHNLPKNIPLPKNISLNTEAKIFRYFKSPLTSLYQSGKLNENASLFVLQNLTNQGMKLIRDTSIAIPVWIKYKKGQTRRFAPTNDVFHAIKKRYIYEMHFKRKELSNYLSKSALGMISSSQFIHFGKWEFGGILGMLSKNIDITPQTPQMILKTEKTHTVNKINNYRDDTNLQYKKSALTNRPEISLSKQIDKQIEQKMEQKMAEFKKLNSKEQSQPAIHTVADQVYSMIEKRIEIEKERRGFV